MVVYNLKLFVKGGSKRSLAARAWLAPSSETQGQLVGATRFSRAKVYDKNGRAHRHLLLPNKFQKCLKSRLLIGQKNFLGSPVLVVNFRP